MKINIHAGHNPDGKTACGAVGLIKESTEARKVKDEVIRLLKNQGITAYDCTCENGSSQADVLNKIVKKCNINTVDLDVSVHFNAGRNDMTGDGKNAGVEIYIWTAASAAKQTATDVLKQITKLGYNNRGVKISKGSKKDLKVLRDSKAPAMLIECCFVDDKDDIKLYNYKTMAKAITEGITGKTISDEDIVQKESTTIYKVQTGAFTNRKNAENLAEQLKKDKFQTSIVNNNGYYKVQTGAFTNRKNAENLVAQLKTKKYTAIIDKLNPPF